MRVLLVDGPKAGEVIETTGGGHVACPVFDSPGGVDHFRFDSETGGFSFTPAEAGVLTFRQVVYQFHRVALFDHIITVGSIEPRRPRDCDLFRLLTSADAKAAVNP